MQKRFALLTEKLDVILLTCSLGHIKHTHWRAQALRWPLLTFTNPHETLIVVYRSLVADSVVGIFMFGVNHCKIREIDDGSIEFPLCCF